MKKKHQFSISSLVSIIIILAFAVVLAEEATAVDLQNCGASASQLIAKFKSDGPNSYISDYQCAPCAKLLYDGTSNPYYCKFTDINGNPYCDACYNTTLSTYGKCKATAVPNQYQCIPCNGPTALTRFTQNTCTDYYGTHPDSCVGSDTLEQYCSSDSTTCLSKSLSCSDYNGVALHAHCDGGKCVCDSGYTDADGDKSNGCEHPACSDSDGGTARFVYGTCDDASLHVDTCSGNFVVEQYCDSTTHKCSSMQLDCTSYQGVALHAHCDGGKCVCDSGYIDENGNAADGCEKATSTCPSNSCDPANNGPNGAGCCSQTGYYHPEKYKDANGCEYCIKGYCETQPACGDECSSTSCCSNNNYCYLEKSNNNICELGYCEAACSDCICSDGTKANDCSTSPTSQPKKCILTLRKPELKDDCVTCHCPSTGMTACNFTGALNCYTPTSQTCSDGTAYGACSVTKPQKCVSGQLVNSCTDCGCPSTGLTVCNATTGACQAASQFCSDGTVYGACSVTKPKKCVNGQLVDDCVNCPCPLTGATVCNSTGALNCYTPPSGQFCSDGTAYGACSVTKPKKCVDGSLVDKCGDCGCSNGQSCNSTTGACYTPTPCTPQCSGKVCGSDNCGGSCGTCPQGKFCRADGTCSVCNGIQALTDCGTCSCPDGCICPQGCTKEGQTINNGDSCGGVVGGCVKASKYCSAGIPCCGHYNISNTCFYGSSCNSNTCSFSSCTMNPDQNCADQGCTGGCTSPVTLPNCTAYCPCGLGCNCPIGCNKENVLVNNNCNGDKCITRRNWTNEISGCCLEESQCLVDPDGSLEQIGNVSAYFSDNKPRCINSGQFILDHYCNNGEWTTRTALIAGELLNFTYADAGRSSDFTLFCDDYTYALNYYEYLPVINYLSQPCSLNNVEIPCLNDICVLRYKDGSSYKVIAATALNWNISNSTPFSFLNAIGRSASYCNAVSGSDYAACSNGKDVWYNPIINAVVFSNTGFSLNPSFIDSLITILRNPFGTLINWINQRNMADQQWPIANFKKLYISSNAGKKVSAFISNNSQASNLFMHFQSFSTDLCSEAETFVPGSCTKATKCDQMINSSVAKGETNKLFDSWAEMTAQLRINASFSQNHCNNCIKDADELGIDCGGNDCPPCNCADFDSDRDEYLDNSYSGIDSCVLGDCNDNDASIHPGATEICDGIDNNCNNQIDEGCPSTLTMQILAPHIGEVIQAGASSYSIIWNLSSPMLTNSFDLEFTLNNGLLNYNNLAINIGKASACAGNTCTYSWSPVTSSKSSQAKIRITARNSTGAAVAAAESGIFTIGPLPQISLIITKPRAGDILNISAGNPINWSAAGPDIGQIQSYSLHYSTADNLGQSGDWSIIGYAQKGSLGYNWIIPNTFTPGQYYIMVKGLAADSSMLVYNISELISTSRWCSYYVGTCSVNPYAYGPSVCSRTQYNITIPLAQQCPSDSGCTQNSNCP